MAVAPYRHRSKTPQTAQKRRHRLSKPGQGVAASAKAPRSKAKSPVTGRLPFGLRLPSPILVTDSEDGEGGSQVAGHKAEVGAVTANLPFNSSSLGRYAHTPILQERVSWLRSLKQLPLGVAGNRTRQISEALSQNTAEERPENVLFVSERRVELPRPSFQEGSKIKNEFGFLIDASAASLPFSKCPSHAFNPSNAKVKRAAMKSHSFVERKNRERSTSIVFVEPPPIKMATLLNKEESSAASGAFPRVRSLFPNLDYCASTGVRVIMNTTITDAKNEAVKVKYDLNDPNLFNESDGCSLTPEPLIPRHRRGNEKQKNKADVSGKGQKAAFTNDEKHKANMSTKRIPRTSYLPAKIKDKDIAKFVIREDEYGDDSEASFKDSDLDTDMEDSDTSNTSDTDSDGESEEDFDLHIDMIDWTEMKREKKMDKGNTKSPVHVTKKKFRIT
ncbi:hypothetical protein K469DRAFT_745447 [Zopfia rhizophila CBS 207.26]|uniref:Uncharacterized protein n=1 Tax=Zopfia rhizophila CBS 207.26 TaxID=1314779 RepID=A0A6A6ENB4_9PEZI|nr:hypothetical protein K469DRAFT_745447 [Zopfia rhizophila CBS 207.26]